MPLVCLSSRDSLPSFCFAFCRVLAHAGTHMLGKIYSATVVGVDACEVEVEVNTAPGKTAVVVVGLPDAAVKESRDRVFTAVVNSGYRWNFGRTTINLAPADVAKYSAKS